MSKFVRAKVVAFCKQKFDREYFTTLLGTCLILRMNHSSVANSNSSDNDKVNSKNHNKKSSSSPRSKKKTNSQRSPTTMLPQLSSISGNESIGINNISGKDKVIRFVFLSDV